MQIQDQSGTTWQEMYKVFNMGHRFEIYANPVVADDIVAIARTFSVDARVIGHVEQYEGKKVTIHSEYGTFEY